MRAHRKLHVIYGKDMKQKRIKEANFIYEQKKMAKAADIPVKFSWDMVELSKIDEDGQYISFFLFLNVLDVREKNYFHRHIALRGIKPSILRNYIRNGDARHE